MEQKKTPQPVPSEALPSALAAPYLRSRDGAVTAQPKAQEPKRRSKKSTEPAQESDLTAGA